MQPQPKLPSWALQQDRDARLAQLKQELRNWQENQYPKIVLRIVRVNK